jgi:hypothetical protein
MKGFKFMEILRKKNQETQIVFPLISSGSNAFYTTSAWSALTNKSVSAYSWQDNGTTPNIASIAGTPLLVVKTTYTGGNTVEIETSSRFPVVSKRIEDINRNLQDSQTVNNPSMPS